jgi:hypothetical protein
MTFRRAVRVKAANAAVGSNPIGAVPRLQQVVDPGMRQPILGGVIGELVTVKT